MSTLIENAPPTAVSTTPVRGWVTWRVLLLSAAVLALFGPVLVGLVIDWYFLPDYSHGFFVPLVSGYLVWSRRKSFAAMVPRSAFSGVFVVLGSLGLLFLGNFGAEQFVTRIAFLGTVAGLIIYFLGWQILRRLAFPLGFLLFMIPLPALVYNQIVFPLQLLASRFAMGCLDALNLFPVLREGNILILPHHQLEVVEACSGIRSLMSLLALSAAYGYFAETSNTIRVLLVIAMVPLAVLSNGLRVMGTALLTQYVGPQTADGFFHAFSGVVIFVAATVLLLILHKAVTVLRKGLQPANSL